MPIYKLKKKICTPLTVLHQSTKEVFVKPYFKKHFKESHAKNVLTIRTHPPDISLGLTCLNIHIGIYI